MDKHHSWLVWFLLLLFKFSVAQEGLLDTTFGDQGTRRFAFVDKDTRGTDLLLLNDNSVILAVNSEVRISGAIRNRGFYIYKITGDGNLDTGFGDNGSVYFPNNDRKTSYFFSMLLQSDGKIVIMGTIEDEPKLIRITPNGTFDPSFGNGGIQDMDSGNRIAQQSTGKIVVQSQYFDGYNNLYRFSRRNTDGSLDTSFGINGTQITDVTFYRFDLCFAIKIDGEDRILAGGPSYNNGDDYHPVITRFTENGTLDASFGNNGTIITTFGPESNLGEINDIALFNDKIILGGNYQYQGGTGGFGGNKPAIAKLNNDGTLDESFGQGGKVVFETYYNANDRLQSIAVQRDGKIILGGGASSPFPIEQTDLFIIKVKSDGSIHSDFGDNGIFITDFGGADASYVTDLALQPDNKILAYGYTKDANNEFRNAIICRLENEVLGVPDLSWENKVQIYPNPFSDYIHIKSKIPIKKLSFYTLLGQLVQTQLYKEDIYEIEYGLSKLQGGVYMVSVSLEGQKTISKKIIKVF
ncbi:MAG: T9SS type A sorting domain-containing protein [Aequorivita sp.]